jgi:hypothetical protein
MFFNIKKSEGRNLEQISGYFPLNLCNISLQDVTNIVDTLANLLPFVKDVKLTLDNLNNVHQFLPEMVDGSLRPGMLQVCDSTCIILDETAMQAGILQERGNDHKTASGASCRSGRRRGFFFLFFSKIYNNSRFARVISNNRAG